MPALSQALAAEAAVLSENLNPRELALRFKLLQRIFSLASSAAMKGDDEGGGASAADRAKWERYRAASLGITAEASMKILETVAFAGEQLKQLTERCTALSQVFRIGTECVLYMCRLPRVAGIE